MRYENDRPVGIDAVVLSTQHSPDVSTKKLREAVMEEIIKPVLPKRWLKKRTQYHINPTGRFVVGGPVGDCGLTGRKIIVDTYGGLARHGGGAFSGKDPSKVDRSAAYAARYVAKNLVAAGLAARCEVQVSYAIGVAEPTSVMVDAFGTSALSREQLTELVRRHFDLTPYGLRVMLDLTKPIYQHTAAYGHFGRKEEHFTWERTDRAAVCASGAGWPECLARRAGNSIAAPLFGAIPSVLFVCRIDSSSILHNRLGVVHTPPDTPQCMVHARITAMSPLVREKKDVKPHAPRAALVRIALIFSLILNALPAWAAGGGTPLLAAWANCASVWCVDLYRRSAARR